ncbi:hypothetical protein QBC45DRAFT_477474 [Copromyces sp. CBS 386.78]|nr:hypothetical protein QBC45DRAFT_477474 [Copromyces sp. CBS 386.78]
MAGKLPGMETQVNQVKKTSASVFESLAWRLFVASRLAQLGKLKVSPWATSYYWRKYHTWKTRWNDLIRFVSTNKAAVSNLFLSIFLVRFAADPCKEQTAKVTNLKTNNERAEKKRAGDEALATLAGNASPAVAENAQPVAEANAELNADLAANDLVAAAGAAGVEGQDADDQDDQEPRGPAFERPQDLRIAQDGWINYQENDFEAMYDIHRDQLEAFKAKKNSDAQVDNNAAIEDNNTGADDGNNGLNDNNANQGNGGHNQADDVKNMYDEICERRRHGNAARAAAPLVAPHNHSAHNQNQNRGGPAMAGPGMPPPIPPMQAFHQQPHPANGAQQPSFVQQRFIDQWPGEAPAGLVNNHHGFGVAVQQHPVHGSNRQQAPHPGSFHQGRQSSHQQRPQPLAPVAAPQGVATPMPCYNQPDRPRQQVTQSGHAMQPPPEVYQDIHAQPGRRGQFQSPGFKQQSMQPALLMGFATPARPHQGQSSHFFSPAQEGVPAGYGTPARMGTLRRPRPAQVQSSPVGQVQHTPPAGPGFIPSGVMTPASKGAGLLREHENQQAVNAVVPVSPAQVLGFPPPVVRNTAPQQAATPQPAQLQPANGQSAFSANMAELAAMQELAGMEFQELTPEELEQWARELQHFSDHGEWPVQQAASVNPAVPAVPAVPERSREELMAFMDDIMDGQPRQQEAVRGQEQQVARVFEQHVAQAAEQQVEVDPLAGLVLNPNNNMSDQELQANVANQGLQIDFNDFMDEQMGLGGFDIMMAQMDSPDDLTMFMNNEAMGGEAINEAQLGQQQVEQPGGQPFGQPAVGNGNQAQRQGKGREEEQENSLGEQQDLLDHFTNMSGEVNDDDEEMDDDDDDLFGDSYVEEHTDEGLDAQESTGTKRKRDDDSDQDGEQPSQQRARMD